MGSEFYLEKMKNRCIAAILGKKEREADRYLPEEISDHLRSCILDEINAYHQTVRHVIAGNINPDFMDKIEEIYHFVIETEFVDD